MLENTSLEEAIELFDRQGNANKERNHDRKQIADWLRELKALQEEKAKREEKLASRRTENKERYYWLKEHHICVHCGQRDAFHKYLYCPECLEKRNEQARQTYVRRKEAKKAYIQHLKEQGLCTWCAKPAVEGKRLCVSCNNKYRAYIKRYRAEHPRAKYATEEERRKAWSENGRRNAIKLNANPTPAMLEARKRRKAFINSEMQLCVAKRSENSE